MREGTSPYSDAYSSVAVLRRCAVRDVGARQRLILLNVNIRNACVHAPAITRAISPKSSGGGGGREGGGHVKAKGEFSIHLGVVARAISPFLHSSLDDRGHESPANRTRGSREHNADANPQFLRNFVSTSRDGDTHRVVMHDTPRVTYRLFVKSPKCCLAAMRNSRSNRQGARRRDLSSFFVFLLINRNGSWTDLLKIDLQQRA